MGKHGLGDDACCAAGAGEDDEQGGVQLVSGAHCAARQRLDLAHQHSRSSNGCRGLTARGDYSVALAQLEMRRAGQLNGTWLMFGSGSEPPINPIIA